MREDLPSYRDQLHRWADSYKEKGWPSETPEYLLTGYFQLLASLGDLPRMITLASDEGRHDLMLGLTGGDSAALAEIRVTFGCITVQDPPDLVGPLAMAIHRDNLSKRNAAIPDNLPAAWAALGHAARAEALAYSLSNPDSRALALAGVAQMLAKTGHRQQASALAEAAETQTRLFTDENRRSQAKVETAEALAHAGQHRNAESVAHSINDPLRRARALAHVAAALVKSGQHQHAAVLAGEADEQVYREDHLDGDQEKAEVAWTLGAAGLHRHAEKIERAITSLEWQPEAPARLAVALARGGHYERAESAALSIADSYWQARALAEIAKSLAEAGHHEQAEAAARSIARPPRWQAEALMHVIRAWSRGGEQQRAVVLAEQAATVASSIIYRRDRALILTQISGVLAEIGERGRAAALARQAEKQFTTLDPRTLAYIAGVLAKAGERRHATRLAERAEGMARSVNRGECENLADIAEALAEIRHEETEAVAYSMPGHWIRPLCNVARTLSEAGEHHRAAVVAARAEARAGRKSNELAHTAAAFAYAGEYGHAEELVRSIKQPDDQVLALTQISEALSKAGARQGAIAAADRAANIADRVVSGFSEAHAWAHFCGARAWAQVTVALARAGVDLGAVASAATHTAAACRKLDYLPQLKTLAETLGIAGARQQVIVIADRAEELTRTHDNPAMMASLACGLAKAGALQHATTIADRAEELTRTYAEPREQARLMMYVIQALTELGRYRYAREIAHSISAQHGQANAFAEIALALARSGSHQSTEAAANLITRPDLPSARHLACLSEALFKAGDTDMARRVAIVTCAADSWTSVRTRRLTVAARPILLQDPSAAQVTVRAVKHWIAKQDSP